MAFPRRGTVTFVAQDADIVVHLVQVLVVQQVHPHKQHLSGWRRRAAPGGEADGAEALPASKPQQRPSLERVGKGERAPTAQGTRGERAAGRERAVRGLPESSAKFKKKI